MTKSRRGFAGLVKTNPDRQRELASRGGSSVPAAKRSFSQNRTLASKAGTKGGNSVPAQSRTFFTNRELAREAGRKGGNRTKALKEV